MVAIQLFDRTYHTVADLCREVQICRATDIEFVGLRPELITRKSLWDVPFNIIFGSRVAGIVGLQAVQVNCRLAKEASNALTKITADSGKGEDCPFKVLNTGCNPFTILDHA